MKNCTTTIFIAMIAKNVHFKMVKFSGGSKLSYLGKLRSNFDIFLFSMDFTPYFLDNNELHMYEVYCPLLNWVQREHPEKISFLSG